jgi:hypothetical protein
MVTRKLLLEYGFDNIDEFFDDIIEKKASGDDVSSMRQFEMLSESQQQRFFNYLDTLYHYEQEDNMELINTLNFFGYDRL